MSEDVVMKVIETSPFGGLGALLATVAFFALRSELLSPLLRRTKSLSFPFGTAHFIEGIELL